MIAWILQITIISFIFIFLVHHLIQFLKDTLTVPKMKDLVNHPNKKYEHIYKILSKENNQTHNKSQDDETSSEISFLPVQKEQPIMQNGIKNDMQNDMKDELKNFLKNQLKSGESSSYYQFT